MKINDLNSIYSEGKYKDVIKAIEKSTIKHPYLNVLKSMAIRLLDTNLDEYSLEDAKKSLEQAIDTDCDFIEAHIELGWYLLNVEDDPKNAIKEFDLALTKSLSQLKEILMGYYLAKNELEEGQFNLDTFVAKIGEELKSSVIEVSAPPSPSE